MRLTAASAPNWQRRKMLLAGAAFCLLKGCGGGSGEAAVSNGAAGAAGASSSAGSVGAGSMVDLAVYGGVPGAAPSAIINAFDSAYAALKANGGGTLLIPPGIYDLGRHDSDAAAVNATGLNNVTISGYGASLRITTTVKAVPAILQYSNCNNITVAGLHFTDPGTDLEVEWKGAACIQSDCTVACNGIKVADCSADQVVALYKSYGKGGGLNYLLTDIDIAGTVNNSYYGINVNYNGAHSKCNLTTNGVRRAFICYGAQYWDIWVNANTSNSAGSNALIELSTASSGLTVSDVNIRLNVTGNLSNHAGLVTFFQQDEVSTPAVIQNINADVRIVNATSLPGAGIISFLYWDGASLQQTTIKTWSNLQLTGGFDAASAALFAGANKFASAGAASSSPNNSVVLRTGQSYQDMTLLPSYFTQGPVAA